METNQDLFARLIPDPAIVPPPWADPAFTFLGTAAWCEYACHYQEEEYGIVFYTCEKPTEHRCTELRCRLDGKRKYYGRNNSMRAVRKTNPERTGRVSEVETSFLLSGMPRSMETGGITEAVSDGE